MKQNQKYFHSSRIRPFQHLAHMFNKQSKILFLRKIITLHISLKSPFW